MTIPPLLPTHFHDEPGSHLKLRGRLLDAYPVAESTSIQAYVAYEKLTGTPFHDQLPYAGGTERLRGYSVYDWVGQEVLWGGVELQQKLTTFVFRSATLQGTLFVEWGRVGNASPYDYGLGLNVLTYPGDTVRLRFDLACNDRGENHFTFSLFSHHPSVLSF